MLDASPVIAFVATTDPGRAKRFYQRTLRLTLVADEPAALVFDANGVMLRIAKVEALAPAQHTVLGWQVSDIETVVDRLRSGGVLFERFASLEQDARGVWESPAGARVAWFKDPDGNLLSLTQF